MSKELTPLEALKIVEYNLSEDGTSDLDNALDIVESALKDYELMKQTKVIVADKKISDDDLEKLKNQRIFIGSIEPLFDEEAQKIESAMSIMKRELPNLLLIRNTGDYDEFLEKSGDNLTEKEYNIVKEVLE